MKQSLKNKTIAFYGDLSFKDSILEILGQHVIEVNLNKENKKPDIVYCIYGAGPSLLTNLFFWFNLNSKIIIHWIGTDVLVWMEKLNTQNLKSRLYYRIWRKLLVRGHNKNKIVNLAGAPWLKEELKSIGIESTFFPITTIDSNVKNIESNLIRENDFITYLPKNRFEFYGGEIIKRLANSLPDNNFIIIHPDLESISPTDLIGWTENVKLFPKLSFNEMQEYLKKSKCFLRFTKHDGLSLSVLEALFNQLTVLWTYSFPHTSTVNLNEFGKIVQLAKDTIINWSPNTSGCEYIINNYSIDNWEKIFSVEFKHILCEL